MVARKAMAAPRRIVLCAHIDSKLDTPGALDNAAGVVTLLLLAELLADYDGGLGVEIVAINGEDYYAASGEKLYLEQNRGKLGDIVLSINLDAPGYRQGPTAYSLYECPDAIAAAIRSAFGAICRAGRGRTVVSERSHGLRPEPGAGPGDHVRGIDGDRNHGRSHAAGSP